MEPTKEDDKTDDPEKDKVNPLYEPYTSSAGNTKGMIVI